LASTPEAAVRACYDAALEVRSKRLTLTGAVANATSATEWTEGRVRDCITNTRRLLDGRSYKRVMNHNDTLRLLDCIKAGFDKATATCAAEMVLEHIAYYADLPTGGKQKNLKQAVEDFLAGLGPTDKSRIDEAFQEKVVSALISSPSERAARLASAGRVPKQITVIAQAFLRNADVVAEVLYRAKGLCEWCKNAAPFERFATLTPYLEVHHTIPLAEGGEDTVANAMALCPNCHREAHSGANRVAFRQ
jgi:5-methylcytosine-specific restriction enzyme A